MKASKYGRKRLLRGGDRLKNLVIKAQRNDAEAFIRLMELNKESMYKIARSYLHCDADVADAMQDTILDCFEKIQTLQKPAYFKTWMIRILINNCNDIIRKAKKLQLYGDYREVEMEAHAEDLTAFLELLETIDEKYRTILILYYVEGYKIKEIAEILEMKESTVNSRLQRSRTMLERELKNA